MNPRLGGKGLLYSEEKVCVMGTLYHDRPLLEYKGRSLLLGSKGEDVRMKIKGTPTVRIPLLGCKGWNYQM